MDTFALEAEVRPLTEKPNQIRRNGRIPAIYYGQGKKGTPLMVAYQPFRKLFEKAGESAIIELTFEGKPHPVLVHEIQYNPVSDLISHIDFFHVDMDKEVSTQIKVVFVGVAPAVKNLGGILDIQKHEIKIKCLPKDLIQSVEVDISSIVDYRTSIHVKDLKIPSTIKVLDNPEDTVVTATPPRAEEETKPAAAAVPEAGAAVPGAVGATAVAGTPVAGAAAPAAGKEGKK